MTPDRAHNATPSGLESPHTVASLLSEAREAGLTGLDAQVIMAHVVQRGREWLLAHPEASMTSTQAATYADLLERRVYGLPVAYLTGEREFYGLPYHVSPAVLIPRPETEHLVEAALEWATPRQSLTGVDVGTGCGAIAVSLAVHLPQARILATDISRSALAVAAHNVQRHGVQAHVALLQADVLAPVRGPLDLVVANLPYIPMPDLSELEVARHEPRTALDGGPDGITITGRLLDQLPAIISRPGLLLVELGAWQGATYLAMARTKCPGADVSMLRDYAGHDRVLRIAFEE